ncbi:MAG TPA: hypothetical protein VFT12_08650, partial [Thermoanaerobaculia bacterium]|nr:hypothetical protein [Thermoanaerobaculia bacterium]
MQKTVRIFSFLLLICLAAPLFAQEEYTVTVTEEMIRHSRIRDLIYFGGFLYGVGVLLLVLATRISAKLRDAAARVTRRPFLLSMIYVALLILVTSVLELPLSYYEGFVVPHQFQLSNQNFVEWIVDQLKGLAIALVLGSLLGALMLLALQEVKRWWLAVW